MYDDLETLIMTGPEDVSEGTPFEYGSNESMAYPDKAVAFASGPGVMTDVVLALREQRFRAKERVEKYTNQSKIAYDLYNNRYEFRNLEHWQSRKVSPRVWTLVEQFSAKIVRMLEKSTDWSGITTDSPGASVVLDFIKSKIHKQINSKEVKFRSFFRRAIKAALLSAKTHVLILTEYDGEPLYRTKTGVDEGISFESLGGFASLTKPEKPTSPGKDKFRLRIELLHHDNISVDKYTGGNAQQGGFKIWDQYLHKGYFKKIAPSLGYDMGAVDAAIDMNPHSLSDVEDDHYFEESLHQDINNTLEYNEDAKITHFYGTLYDPHTHDIIVDNKYFVVLNDYAIILPPEDFPFWEEEDPIVSAPLIEDPHNMSEGRSPIIMNIDQFVLAQQLQNLMEDFYVASLLGMREIDLDMLEDFDEDFREGWYPGRAIYKRGGGNPNSQAVKHVPFTQTDPGLWNYFGIFERNAQVTTLMPDGQSGMPKTRGRTTNMEDARRAAEGGDVLNAIFEGLDDNFLTPFIQKIFYRILQFTPADVWEQWSKELAQSFTDSEGNVKEGALTPEQLEWLGTLEEFGQWTPEQRWEKMASIFRVEVRVFSTLGDRQRLIEQATFFLQTIAQIPQAIESVHVQEVVRYLAQAFGWSTDKVLKTYAVGDPKSVDPDYNPFEEASGAPSLSGPPSQGGGDALGKLSGPMYQGMAQSISTSPPFAPGTGGEGAPP